MKVSGLCVLAVLLAVVFIENSSAQFRRPQGNVWEKIGKRRLPLLPEDVDKRTLRQLPGVDDVDKRTLRQLPGVDENKLDKRRFKRLPGVDSVDKRGLRNIHGVDEDKLDKRGIQQLPGVDSLSLAAETPDKTKDVKKMPNPKYLGLIGGRPELKLDVKEKLNNLKNKAKEAIVYLEGKAKEQLQALKKPRGRRACSGKACVKGFN